MAATVKVAANRPLGSTVVAVLRMEIVDGRLSLQADDGEKSEAATLISP